ncbi:hypothetical protein BD779DRAFT_1554243 [Infundibulicybe gibba]|nr:hypothetical protein BD779DRAFT_1554243 [Infundibulicybe gibba]
MHFVMLLAPLSGPTVAAPRWPDHRPNRTKPLSTTTVPGLTKRCKSVYHHHSPAGMGTTPGLPHSSSAPSHTCSPRQQTRATMLRGKSGVRDGELRRVDEPAGIQDTRGPPVPSPTYVAP